METQAQPAAAAEPAARPCPMVVAAARELCRLHAAECGVNNDDLWAIYSEDFTADAGKVLAVAGVPEMAALLCEAQSGVFDNSPMARNWNARVNAALASTTRSAL